MRSRLITIAFLAFVFATYAGAATRIATQHAAVELVAEKTSLVPGERTWVGVMIAHESNWHTYWVNPGDSGLPTKLQWRLPENYRAGDIAWPAPKRFDLGSLYNFGYDETVLLPVPIDVPLSARIGTSVKLEVDAKWLICSHEICLPGKATLQLDMPVANDPKTNAANAPLFVRAREELPKASPWQGIARLRADRINIELRGTDLPNPAALEVFSATANVTDNRRPKISAQDGRLVIDAAKSDYLENAPSILHLVLTERTGDQVGAWQIEVPVSKESKSH